jgi:hypothetical protein
VDASAQVRGERRAEHAGERLVQDPQRPEVLLGELVRAAEVVQLGRPLHRRGRRLRAKEDLGNVRLGIAIRRSAGVLLSAEQRLAGEEGLDLCL